MEKARSAEAKASITYALLGCIACPKKRPLTGCPGTKVFGRLKDSNNLLRVERHSVTASYRKHLVGIDEEHLSNGFSVGKLDAHNRTILFELDEWPVPFNNAAWDFVARHAMQPNVKSSERLPVILAVT
jgi:hypothetical protein